MTSTSSARTDINVDDEHDIENLDYYRVEDYKPVQLSDQIKESQYKVVPKLGYGCPSTVWLAKDINDRYVLLKILRAEKTESSSEIMIRGLLRYKKWHQCIIQIVHMFLSCWTNSILTD